MKVYRPKSVHVRIASGCNLGCVMCERELLPASDGGLRKRSNVTFIDGRGDLNLERDMTPATWRKTLETFGPYMENWELGGLGEPTTGALFVPAAKEILSRNWRLFFYTNGHYLARAHVMDALAMRPENVRISISMDAGTPEGYARIRKGDLAELIASVTAFKERFPEIRIDSQFTAMADNVEELPAWVELCARLGIGRFDREESLMIIGADHHVTSRVDKSVRFYEQRTRKAVDAARVIAERERLWMVANLPNFSELNANAGEDGSDPGGFRRWSDLLLGEENPCNPATPASIEPTSVLPTGTIETLEENTGEIGGARMASAWLPASDATHDPAAAEILIAPREIYVDYDGQVWTCLARHTVGKVGDDFLDMVDRNDGYQKFLSAWYYGVDVNDKSPACKSCPRRK